MLSSIIEAAMCTSKNLVSQDFEALILSDRRKMHLNMKYGYVEKNQRNQPYKKSYLGCNADSYRKYFNTRYKG